MSIKTLLSKTIHNGRHILPLVQKRNTNMLVMPIFMNSSDKKKMSSYYPRNPDIYRLINSIDEEEINKFKIYEDNIS